jgi:hypothetical protein
MSLEYSLMIYPFSDLQVENLQSKITHLNIDAESISSGTGSIFDPFKINYEKQKTYFIFKSLTKS